MVVLADVLGESPSDELGKRAVFPVGLVFGALK
jgi:hypothetical protein